MASTTESENNMDKNAGVRVTMEVASNGGVVLTTSPKMGGYYKESTYAYQNMDEAIAAIPEVISICKENMKAWEAKKAGKMNECGPVDCCD